jgi:uncharacterized membrane protein
MRRNNSVINLTFFAICLALILLMSFVPQLGYITIGVISFTLIHIPVLVFSYLKGWKWGWVYGLVFGLSSFLVAITRATGGLDIFFANYPIVAIVPRLLFGFLSGLVFSLIKKTIPDRSKRKLVLAPTCFVLTVIHSLLVFLFLYLFAKDAAEAAFGGAFWPSFYSMIFLVGTLPEAGVAFITVPLICWPLEPFYERIFKNAKEAKKESRRLTLLLEKGLKED